MVFLGATVLGALAGWIFFDRDPSQLMVVFGALATTATALEGGMAAKRATFKKEAVQTQGESRHE